MASNNEINNKLELHRREDPFIRLDKNIILDNRLSWKAKGILSYLLSRPQNWQFYFSEILSHSTDGRDSLRAGLNELEKLGYLHRVQSREGGRFDVLIWHVYEIPVDTTNCLNNGIPTANGFSVNGKTVNGKTVNGKPDTNKNKDSVGNDFNKKESTTWQKTEKTKEGNPPVLVGAQRTLKDLNEVLIKNNLQPLLNTANSIKALTELLTMSDDDLKAFIDYSLLLAKEDQQYLVTIRNPISFIITHPEAIYPITKGTLSRKVKNKQNISQKKNDNGYEIYVPPNN